jgi:hypothetical protein
VGDLELLSEPSAARLLASLVLLFAPIGLGFWLSVRVLRSSRRRLAKVVSVAAGPVAVLAFAHVTDIVEATGAISDGMARLATFLLVLSGLFASGAVAGLLLILPSWVVRALRSS